MATKKKSERTSRPIVIGQLEKVSRGIFDKYQRQITDMIKGHHGVYALYRKETLYYIGLATNLRNRIRSHLKDRHGGSWTHFSLYVFRGEGHIRELEALLLRIAYPKGNRIRGKLKGSKDFTPALKRQLRALQSLEMVELFRSYKIQTEKGHKVKKSRKPKADRPLRGVFPKGKMIYRKYKGKLYKAWVRGNGRVKYEGLYYDSPSTAGSVARGGKSTNGWRFWMYKNKSGDLVPISELRE